MKNCESVKTVNVILSEDYGTETQTRNFLHSCCQQKDVNINITGKINNEITKDYLSYLTFNEDSKGLKIYHSARIILGESDVYKYLLNNPKNYIVPLQLDQIAQKYYPYLPKNIPALPVKPFNACITTELHDFIPGQKLCYYQM